SFTTCFILPPPRPPTSTLFPYTTLFRSTVTTQNLDCITGHLHRPVRSIHLRHCRVSPKLLLAAINHLGGIIDQQPRRLNLRRHRSEEHTSELQSPDHLVCRLLLEKKKHN